MINSDDEYPELSDKVILGKEIDALRARLATAEAQVAAAQSERDMTRAMAAERAALRAGLAAAEEQLADANRGYSLLCDEEARLNDDLAAARRALEEMRGIKERAERELYVAGCVDDGVSPTMRLLWRVLGLAPERPR